MASLLKIDDLRLEFSLSGGARIYALRGVHLQIEPGICYGILGESGSGKSTLAKAVMQLLPKSAKVTPARSSSTAATYRSSPLPSFRTTTAKKSPSSRKSPASRSIP